MLGFLNPFTWLRWLSQFVAGWFLSLPLRDVPKALPAVAAGALFVACTIAAWSQNSNWRGRLLDEQMFDAFERDDYQTAELVLSRKMRLSPGDAALIYRFGITKDALGQTELASEIMNSLVSGRQHEPAARWLLEKRFIGRNWKELSIEEREDFGRILKLINRESPKDFKARQLYADYLIANGQMSKAIPLLDDLARVQPMRGLQAAAIARKLGNDATATRLAKRTLGSVQKILEEDPSNAILTLAVAQNQLFLKRYPESVRTLERGIKLAKKEDERKKLSVAMGDAIVAWVGFIEQSPADSDIDRQRILKMLQVALTYAPNNPRVLTLVADQVLATMHKTDAQTRALRKALVEGTSPGIAHFIRGTAALINDDFERAERSLALAEKELPRSGAILNNLAVAMAMGDDPKLEIALVVSNKAIDMTPSATPHFFETRGQILFRLDQYMEAIPDLEKALPVKTLALKAHESLAVCYEKIGEPDLAAMHSDAVKDLKN